MCSGVFLCVSMSLYLSSTLQKNGVIISILTNNINTRRDVYAAFYLSGGGKRNHKINNQKHVGWWMRALFTCFLFYHIDNTTQHTSAYVHLCWYLMLMISDLFLTLYGMYCLFDSISISFSFAFSSLYGISFRCGENKIWKEALKCRNANLSLFS